MSKRSKLEKIHRKIMCASSQIKVLSNFIITTTENDVENQVIASIINEKSMQIKNENEKMGMILKF